jgi:hypothetical protein
MADPITSEVNDRLTALEAENADLRRAVFALFHANQLGTKVDLYDMASEGISHVLESREVVALWQEGYTTVYACPSDERRREVNKRRDDVRRARQLLAGHEQEQLTEKELVGAVAA